MTTSIKSKEFDVKDAYKLAESLQIPYVPREKRTLRKMFIELEQKEAIIVSRITWRYERKDGYCFQFHPSMSALRIKQLQLGGIDSLQRAAKIEQGDTVLDCTLGMGADAIVASFLVGEEGEVLALESQPIIAHLVRHGLATFQTDRKVLKDAMQRVKVMQIDYREYLKSCKSASFDYVIFDPMFRETIHASQSMQQLKQLANPHPLDQASVQEAWRVARKAVLLKERLKSEQFQLLGFHELFPSSQYAWGVKRKEE
ncbi:Putative SAM-dependent methyltransferase [Seinonella peptonophila]|uniref:Putative SAM-dependent methyltransferase n=1 Tax=Seinonella peptonophila TaxID=112248 RepID=A0A1M4T1Y4_9BACL|nr:class I SAM-dependent methyltransferase [Seinonella peptonophila]SHE38502.1 Putative SAM-dependent methyltransferase [Seinonella peptonophila]